MVELVKESIRKSHPFTILSDSKNTKEAKLRKRAIDGLDQEKAKGLLKFLQFIKPENKKSLLTIGNILNEGEVNFFSACCFHAEEDRQKLVDKLSPHITDLICETMKRATENLPLSSWNFYTFGPGDWDFLAEWGILETILPYINDLPYPEKELKKQFQLTQSFVDLLSNRLSFSVKLSTLQRLSKGVEKDLIVKEAEVRAQAIYQKLRRKPPAIFELLPSEEARLERCKKEAILYLLFTEIFGSNGFLYLGLEVHGGYWKSGKLNERGNKYLPLTWFHPVLCQHWGPWAEEQKKLRLKDYEAFLGQIN